MGLPLDGILKLSTGIFMAGNLLWIGLGLRAGEAFQGLHDRLFVFWGLICGFLLGPALAFGVVWIFRIEDSYAAGILVMGLAPCAPFLPGAVERAKGNLSAAAAFLLLATGVSLLVVPFAVPRLVPGLAVDTSSMIQTLVLYLLFPLVVGVGLRGLSECAARQLRWFVKGITTLSTVVLLGLCLYLYRTAIWGTFGSRSLLALATFTAILLVGVWAMTRSLPVPKRSVLALGVGTRNLGVPFAVLSSAQSDERAIAVVALAVPVTLVGAFVASAWFARRSH